MLQISDNIEIMKINFSNMGNLTMLIYQEAICYLLRNRLYLNGS